MEVNEVQKPAGDVTEESSSHKEIQQAVVGSTKEEALAEVAKDITESVSVDIDKSKDDRSSRLSTAPIIEEESECKDHIRSFLDRILGCGKSEDPINPADREKNTDLLKAAFAVLQVKENFAPGDILEWKPGFQNRRLPKKGDVAIVTDVAPVDKPFEDSKGEGAYAAEILDLRIGSFDTNGFFVQFTVPSKLFQKAKIA